MRLYVAGPMTGLSEFNYPAFREAEQQLADAGYQVVSPRKDGDEDLWETKPYEFFLRRGFEDVLVCDGLALLNGWERSKGVSMEIALATWIKIPIFTIQYWLAKARRERCSTSERPT